jgi:hypothetical protein
MEISESGLLQLATMQKNEMDVMTDAGRQLSSARPVHELDDDFWEGVDYCGYLRCSFQSDSVKAKCGSGFFVNGTYARLVGMNREEMMTRLSAFDYPLLVTTQPYHPDDLRDPSTISHPTACFRS